MRPVDEHAAEDALILRPHLDVSVRSLPPGGAAFIAALRRGATLAEAAEHAVDDDAGFDLTANLAGLIGSGAVTGYPNLPKDRDHERHISRPSAFRTCRA